MLSQKNPSTTPTPPLYPPPPAAAPNPNSLPHRSSPPLAPTLPPPRRPRRHPLPACSPPPPSPLPRPTARCGSGRGGLGAARRGGAGKCSRLVNGPWRGEQGRYGRASSPTPLFRHRHRPRPVAGPSRPPSIGLPFARA
jgi:hypothetical protein